MISAMDYFILTWTQKPENYNITNYLTICFAGILLTILFHLLHSRITKLIWKCQNSAYLIEKDLGFTTSGPYIYSKLGLYGNIVDERVREKLDEGILDMNQIKVSSFSEKFSPKGHRGGINSLFILVYISFLFLAFQFSGLNLDKNKWEEKQNILFELNINNSNMKKESNKLK